MVVTTRSVFIHQLDTLQENTLQLAEMVQNQLTEAVKALQSHDKSLSQQVATDDTNVNKLRYTIEEQCYTLLALQQPNSSDMRRIVATISVATNLERMGDHAAGISRLALQMNSCTIDTAEFDMMTQKLVIMLKDTMQALTTSDNILASAISDRDDDIDHLHDQFCSRMIRLMIDDPSTIENATKLQWVSHNIERYADRICNICERIHYLVTGFFSYKTEKMISTD